MYYFRTWLIAALLVVFLSHCDQNIQANKPVKQDAPWAVDWWETRHNEKLAQAKSTEIDLLMIGDSITHGWETTGVTVWQQNFQDKKAFNLGFSGDRTEHVLWRLQNGGVDGMSPKLTVLMIGTNNTFGRMDPAEHTAKGISAIVFELRTRLPMSKILLLGIFPSQYSPDSEVRIRNKEISKLISKLADGKNIYYQNINEVFLDENQILQEKFMPDLLHPNILGYQLWAKAMTPTINRLMD